MEDHISKTVSPKEETVEEEKEETKAVETANRNTSPIPSDHNGYNSDSSAHHSHHSHRPHQSHHHSHHHHHHHHHHQSVGQCGFTWRCRQKSEMILIIIVATAEIVLALVLAPTPVLNWRSVPFVILVYLFLLFDVENGCANCHFDGHYQLCVSSWICSGWSLKIILGGLLWKVISIAKIGRRREKTVKCFVTVAHGTQLVAFGCPLFIRNESHACYRTCRAP